MTLFREIITVESPVYLNLPKEFKGKRVEITVVSVEDIQTNEQPTPTKQKTGLSKLRGTLPQQSADSLETHLKQIREEWDRDF